MNVKKCPSCSTLLNGQEIFCSACGAPTNTGSVHDKEQQHISDHTHESLLFHQPTESLQKWQIPLLIVGVIIIESVFFTVVAAVGGGTSSVEAYSLTNNSNVARTANSSTYVSGKSNSSYSSTNANAYYNSGNNSASSAIGSRGYLVENLNIRSAPNRNAEILGTHYKDAQIQVLDEESYSTTDGYAIWYKVKVLNYGCDSQNSSSCGKNWERNGSFGWMEGADEGWMNSKFISLN